MILQIEQALSPIGLFVFDHFFDSTKKYKDAQGNDISINEYITYYVIQETPITYADNVDEYTELTIDVNCFTQNKTNANTYKLKIRDALRNAGFTITDTILQYESDTRYYHSTISISKIENTEKYGG